MTLILPVLVAVFGILSVYGRQGWLASLFHALGWQWDFSPYGLQGILLAHVFSICRWPPACCCRRWRVSLVNSGKLPPSLACAAMPSSASSNGRGCAGTFPPSLR
ncbi:hypothetical protein LNO36_04510 [Klebsiella variicola subsp. variicola]|nr:hypothetical protein [Klebsiella variicola subsp. variicola]